jgi:hypothetical protein
MGEYSEILGERIAAFWNSAGEVQSLSG